MDDTSDKPLPASANKLRKARDKGQVARSRELVHLVLLLTALCMAAALLPAGLAVLRDDIAFGLRFDHRVLGDSSAWLGHMAPVLGHGLAGVLLAGVLLALAALLGTFSVGGLILSATPLMPDFSRISPVAGLGRLFSMRQLAETGKLVLICAAIGFVGWHMGSARLQELASLSQQDPHAALPALGSLLLASAGACVLVLLAAALLDVPLQWQMHRRQLRMSHEEARQEHKELEGQPQVKARIRARQRELARRQAAAAVPQADLVLVNPTHYAVALKYDEAAMSAPRVVAKGADLLATRIRELARAHEVPILRAPVLARALYAHADVGAEVPASLYGAVAQVLAHVYHLRAALRGQAPMPAEFVPPQVPAGLDPHERRDAAGAAA